MNPNRRGKMATTVRWNYFTSRSKQKVWWLVSIISALKKLRQRGQATL